MKKILDLISDPIDQLEIGLQYRDGDRIPQNYVKARKWFRKSAEQGNEYAQYNLACLYAYGMGVQPNYIIAEKWFLAAAANGNIAAMPQLEKLRKILDIDDFDLSEYTLQCKVPHTFVFSGLPIIAGERVVTDRYGYVWQTFFSGVQFHSVNLHKMLKDIVQSGISSDSLLYRVSEKYGRSIVIECYVAKEHIHRAHFKNTR